MELSELNPIDRHFAALLQRIASNPSPELEIAAQLVSKFQADGHVCLPLSEVTPGMLAALGISWPLPVRKTWVRKLRESGVVGETGEYKPLILDKAERLYLQRYWAYEIDVARDISSRLKTNQSVNQIDLGQHLKRLFTQESQFQKLAAIVAATSSLSLISGAPGTGKTHIIVMICALLLALSPETKIALAAPTGKAAARLREALARARTSLKIPDEITARLPADASTIQRLLGVLGDSGRFRHHRENPLDADLVIVDEASMVDLALLAKLLDAVRPEARVILVGDKDQLASVEAGSAFRDICTPGFTIGISNDQARSFKKCTGQELRGATPQKAPIHEAVVELRENFRFAAGSGIGELSEAVNEGDYGRASAILKSGRVKWRPTPPAKTFERALRNQVFHHFEKLCAQIDPREALARLNEFVVLCALRRGPYGAERVNGLIERMLFEAGKKETTNEYFSGQPLMIVRNDYDIELFNGDLGIVLPHGDGWRAFFPGEGGDLRSFSPARLPAHETAFALTVHKSQGSEFREVLLILPEEDAPVLTRELLYTAVTRSRRDVELWASEAILRQTIGRKVRRNSGLRDWLWGGENAN
ncbi:MAG TPA: exodeoxyribonuclease V subunit alpha [Chthoniobacterales bacterium]|jgi:exodeoxyribonuclease V alpha subunit